ncbi:MAG TPA: amino acid adenylation domain-containing protein, partial [Longimicrobiaceae bacterium]|nr:amino acid adenylation domain-containing protein [Longimicrobiaceae bacterium]
LRLDADWDSIATESADDPGSVVTPNNLAYVIYTSGSTGRPKGVMVPHRGVLNLVQAQNEAFRIGPGSRVLQFASFSFDAAVSEVLTALLAGARLHLAPQAALMPGDPLLGTLRDEAISVVTLPPSALAVLPDAELPALRTLVSAGEACPAEVPRRWAPGRHFVNAYGPTETTVCASLSPEDGTRPPRIGGPIDNARIYVLDAGLHLAPVGVPGEVCVAGAGLARGYRGKAALTASSFVPDPFSEVPGGRLYRTGDRARWHDDGTLEYLGRLDDQVKIRGFRIEPGEIEAALRAHPAVADAAVVARPAPDGDRRLAAYVVLRGDAPAGSAELRAHLKGGLPEHMVPAHVMVMDAFPLTPNGKVDRAALPAPDANEAERAPYAPPRTPAELAMAEIWAEVLGVHPVGIHDDFFALGGHSLLATRVVSRARRSLGVDLALRHLFEAPTIAGLCHQLQAAGDAAAAPPIAPADRSRPLPLSFAQERLWFVDRLVPGSIAYNMPVLLPVHGAPVEVVRRVLDEVVARHETLRTTFADVGGTPAQRVAPPAPVPLHVVDLSEMAGAERARAVPRIFSDEMNRPFNLEHGPLFRATLLRVSDEEQTLVLVMHHIVSDAWSVDVLTAEVRTLLAAFLAGEPSPLPPLPLQYADFAVWQRAWLSGGELERQAAYWKQALAGIPEALELPMDRPRPPVQTFGGRTVARPLPRALVRRLNALGREQGVTLYMTMLAAFSVVLGRWSGQDDVVIGSPIAGRSRGETEPMIGVFINNLVMRTDLSGAPSFRTLLGRVRDVTLGAYAHEDLPFERLVDALDVPRSTSHTPIFQVLFNLLTPQDVQGGGAEMPDEVTEMDEPAKYDLSLTVADLGTDMGATLNFNVDLFDSATIRRMMAHLVSVLEQVTAAPDLSIADIDLLPAEERALVVGEWNDTARPYPTGLRIHDLFEAQVRATPDAPALVFGGDVLTYAELNARANRLAHHLIALGVGPEVRVGVAMERTPDLIVGLFAVLKAGGAYVPVDPAYPADRIAYMLEDSGASVVLTQARVASNLPATTARIVAVDTDAEAIASRSAENPVAASTPQNAAYAIYTSGSTGRPKGVVIEHRSTVVVLQWLQETVTDEERSSSLGSTSISFDVSIAEIFGTLCWGGKLVLVENALSLAELGEEAGIKLATMVPSAAQVLLRMGGIPSTVRSLNLGGEPLPNALAQALYRTGTVEKVLNLYGPTEDTTYSTWSLIEEGGAKVYVGRPVANTQAYIVDDALRPVPIGVPGELYLAGDGLSRGYLNRPGLTAERYIPNPFGPAGSRMYRVGDLTRYLVDGTIEYLGRLDHQVKIRGF